MRILKFGSDWCGPCKVMHEKLKNCKYPLEEIDVDEHEDLTEKYGIRSIPVTVIVDNAGEVLAKWVGLTDLEVIESKFEELSR